jgi:hypothetical protein
MPFRIWVIGRSTSSAPGGNSMAEPAGPTGAGGAAGVGAVAGVAAGVGAGVAAGAEPFVAPTAGTGTAGTGAPVRIDSTTWRTSSRVIRPPPQSKGLGR